MFVCTSTSIFVKFMLIMYLANATCPYLPICTYCKHYIRVCRKHRKREKNVSDSHSLQNTDATNLHSHNDKPPRPKPGTRTRPPCADRRTRPGSRGRRQTPLTAGCNSTCRVTLPKPRTWPLSTPIPPASILYKK